MKIKGNWYVFKCGDKVAHTVIRISVSDSEEKDEITQLNRPEIENKEGVIEEVDIEEQGVVGRPPSLAWLCFDKSKIYKKNGKNYIKYNQSSCNGEFIHNKSTASHLVRHVKMHACSQQGKVQAEKAGT